MRASQQGLSLLEIMIGLALSLIIVAGGMTVYLSCKRNAQLQQALANMQENARVSLYLLDDAIRGAGYLGCPRFDEAFCRHHFRNTTRMVLSPQTMLQINHAVLSDELVVTQAQNPGAYLIHDQVSAGQLWVSVTPRFKAQQVIVISDCHQAVVTTVKRVAQRKDGQVLQLTWPLTESFKRYAMVSPLEVRTFFVKATIRKTKQGRVVSALFQKDADGHAEELVPGIAKMRLSFVGHDQSLLAVHLQTENRRLHRQWSTRIALRNLRG